MSTTYRWDQATAARDYDRSAPVIHPHYCQVQETLLEALPFCKNEAFHAIDLGGGSGRLAEQLLARFPEAKVTLVDPSEAFLKLAQARLSRAGIAPSRVRYLRSQAQETAWQGQAEGADAILSTSALHHLDRHEKDAVFCACRRLLRPGGVFLNGDEYRPASDRDYRELLIEWGEQMDSSLAAGAIPESFREVLAKWRRRNLDGFGGPRQSGEDCHETVEEQTARLYGAGFKTIRTLWHEQLWAVLIAQ